MKKSNFKLIIFFIIAIILIYMIFHILGIGCPIKFLTGISCAGCGMSRAYLHVLKLDFNAAFHYHPLWPLVPVAGLLLIGRRKYNKKLFIILIGIIVALFIIIYIIRLISTNDSVVIIDISESAVVKLIKMFRRILEL